MGKSIGEATELLLLADEREVRAFDLTRRRRVTAGRHPSNDLRLGSQTVSSFHAELLREEDGILLRDLGSTNGTFVNGELVESKRVGHGDRIRMGNHTLVLELQTLRGGGALADRPPDDGLAPGRSGRVLSYDGASKAAQATVPGVNPRDFTLPDLIRLGATSVAPLKFEVRHGDETAVVWFRHRGIVHAELGSARGVKALYRLLSWVDGTYEAQSVDVRVAIPRSISLPTEALLREGLEQASELETLRESLPPLDAPLRPSVGRSLSISAHTPAEIEVLQLVSRHLSLSGVMEASALADARVLGILQSLLEKGVIESEPATSSSLPVLAR